jgi:hypothetical protein
MSLNVEEPAPAVLTMNAVTMSPTATATERLDVEFVVVPEARERVATLDPLTRISRLYERDASDALTEIDAPVMVPARIITGPDIDPLATSNCSVPPPGTPLVLPYIKRSLLVPDIPEKPLTPEYPEIPENPENPEILLEPENPLFPEKPEVPLKPLVPEKPDVPLKPLVPEKPDVPLVPLKPEAPENPDWP